MQGKPLPENISPQQMLRYAGKEVLQILLRQAKNRISTHNISDGSKAALQRIREGIISASTAKTLSTKKNVGESLAHSTALLRELGLTLIAWNYPKLYERTVKQLQKGQSLDDALAKQLGFSPRLLAIALARKWKLLPELRHALGDRALNSELSPARLEQIEGVSAKLEELCQAGEALARATAPEMYPSARSDWHAARDLILDTLGPNGLREIVLAAEEHCESYLDIFPGGKKSIQSLLRAPDEHESGVRFSAEKNNRFVKNCPSKLRESLIELYGSMPVEGPSSLAIERLIKKLIPEAGFHGGCVFLLNDQSMQLEPRVKIGSPDAEILRIRNGNSSITKGNDIVLEAFHCNTPVIQSAHPGIADARSCIAASIGKSNPMGVLYLEIEDALEHSRTTSALVCFKALHLALSHALSLRNV